MNFFEKVYYKLKLDIVWNTFTSTIDRIFWKPFKIMTATETVSYIREHKCSVARFGDGELHIAAYGCPLRFQRADKQLQVKLNQVIQSSNPNLLLCLPNRINAISQKDRAKLPAFWRKALPQHLHPWTKNFSKSRIYGDTNLSRLTDFSSRDETIQHVQYIKNIWSCRNIIMVEGEKTRFGVGNDLFDNAQSVHRILGPAESAFDCYEELLNACSQLAKELHDPLILLALGPTATALASDLADRNIQAIDIGHLDISYEKLKSGQTGAVYGKYTNEAVGGNIVADCFDETYLSEIVLRIGT